MAFVERDTAADGMTWVSTAGTTATTVTTAVWFSRDDSATSTCTSFCAAIPQAARRTLPQIEHRAERRMAEQVEHQAELRLADERADRLLREFLTVDQLAQLAERRWFETVGRSGRRYRLTPAVARVCELDEAGQAVASFCIHPDDGYPSADVVLAQKLLLEADEALFLRTANRTPLFTAAAGGEGAS